MSANKELKAPVIIVGGGIGGASAALALSRKGIRSIVLEQATVFRELGAGIQMPPNAFKAFERLGVVDQVLEAAAFPEALYLMDAITGEQVVKVPVGLPEFKQRFKYAYALMHRGDLLELLIDACRASPLVELRTGMRVSDFVDHGDRVVASMENGEKVEGSALIGADGLWSLTRNKVVGDGQPLTEGDIIFRAVIPFEEVPSELYQTSVVMWGGPFMDFAHYPLRRGEIYNMAAIFRVPLPQDGSTPKGTAEQLMERFERACPAVRALIPKLDTSRQWVLYERPAIRDWSKGRVALLGDAAHAGYHYIAQGACMALEDSVVLADVMAESATVQEGFDRYRDARYLRTARVQFTARQFGELYHADGIHRDLRRDVLGKLTPQKMFDNLSWVFDGV
jgi:salicylate hydroxylase